MTGVRGAAALFVMFYHFEYDLPDSGPLSTMLNHGYLSVDLFFVLSGFVLSHVYGRAWLDGSFSFGDFLRYRLARIYPVYILATAGILAIESIRAVPGALDWKIVLSNLVMLQSLGNWPSIDPPAWSVSVEMLAYLLFPALAMLCLNSRWRAAATAVAALAAVLALSLLASLHWIGSPIGRGQLDLFYEPFTLIRCLAGFTIGQLIWRIHQYPSICRLTSRNSVQTLVVLAGLLLMAVRGSDFLIYLAIIGLIFCLSSNRGVLPSLFGSRPMHFLGRISFPVYLTHFRAVGVVGSVNARLGPMGIAHGLRQPIALLSAALLVVGVSWLVHDMVERPCRKLLAHAHGPAMRVPLA